MAVKGLVQRKSGQSSVLRKGHFFLICTEAPFAYRWPCWHGSRGQNRDRETILIATTVFWAGREESLNLDNGNKCGEEGQRHMSFMRPGAGVRGVVQRKGEGKEEEERMILRSVCRWSCQSQGRWEEHVGKGVIWIGELDLPVEHPGEGAQ